MGGGGWDGPSPLVGETAVPICLAQKKNAENKRWIKWGFLKRYPPEIKNPKASLLALPTFSNSNSSIPGTVIASVL